MSLNPHSSTGGLALSAASPCFPVTSFLAQHANSLFASSLARIFRLTAFVPLGLSATLPPQRRKSVVWHHALLLEHVALRMPLKRKPAHGAACAPVLTSNGSRFVACPICSQKVAYFLINSHLDSECGKSTSSPAEVAHNPCLQLQDPKRRRSRHTHVGTGVQHTNSTRPCQQLAHTCSPAITPQILVQEQSMGSRTEVTI
jgi:hypothetical protein